MDTKKVTIGVFVATTLVFGVLAFKTPTVVTVPEVTQLGSSAPVVNVPAPVVNVEAAKVNVPAPIVNVTVPKQDVKLGSVASPDIQSPYFSVGGVRIWANGSDSLVQSTTTPWAYQFQATTTVLFAGCKLDVSSTTAVTARLSKATTAFATTTALGQLAVAANGKGTLIASTTLTAGYTSTIFEPRSWIVFSMQGGTGTFSPTGSCNVLGVQN